MPRGRYSVLRSQARNVVYNLLNFMKKEAEEGLQFDLDAVQKRTAAATGISEKILQRIAVAGNDQDSSIAVLLTPAKRKKKKRLIGIDNFDRRTLRRMIHNFHNTERELPTLKQLLRKLKDDFNFKGNMSSLKSVLKELSFKRQRTEDNRKVFTEHSNIRLKRMEYLDDLTKYRMEGRPIIYTYDSSLDPAHTSMKSWSDDTIKEIKKCITKGQQVGVVHAGSEEGFIPNTLLLFSGDSKSGDHIQNMNYENYEMWINNQLMPNLPKNSVVVLGNASYYNKVQDAAPKPNSKKSEMESWLHERGIPFSSEMYKPQLYKLICLHKNHFRKYCIDNILKENTFRVLRLPINHHDLNPMEMAWADIKEHVAQKNTTWNINTLMSLVEEKINAMSENEWTSLFRNVKSIEEQYKKSDMLIDTLTEEIVIHHDDNKDHSENESERENDGESGSEYENSLSDEEVSCPSMKVELAPDPLNV